MTSGIIEILKENTALAALVGTDHRNEVKIYPFIAPEKVSQPYIIVSEVSVSPAAAKMCIPSLDYANYEVNCYGLSFHGMEILQRACRAALEVGQGFTTDAGALFGYIRMTTRRDLYLHGEGQGNGLYVKSGTYEAEVRGDI